MGCINCQLYLITRTADIAGDVCGCSYNLEGAVGEIVVKCPCTLVIGYSGKGSLGS